MIKIIFLLIFTYSVRLTIGNVSTPPLDDVVSPKPTTPTADKQCIQVHLADEETPQLPKYLPALMGCRSVENFEQLNRIEEGTYGVVFRAKDKKTRKYSHPSTVR